MRFTRPGIGLMIGAGNQSTTPPVVPVIINDKLLFWGKVSEITAGAMPNKVTGSSDSLTVGGTEGAYTFQCPNTAPYKNADTDYIWFKTDETLRTPTEAELVSYDFPRTLVKYDNTTPYLIREIIILADGETLTTAEENALRDYMELSIWWSNVLSINGNLKENREAEQSTWTPEVIGIFDADGNEYTEVVIGTQTWLLENLKTTKYNDASSIPTALSDANWVLEDGTSGHDGAFAQVNGDAGNKTAYGLLYNWYAANNAKGICPAGYKIPSLNDWLTIATYLGGSPPNESNMQETAGGHMKESGTTHWTSSNADNSSGLTLVGAGIRWEADGSYLWLKDYACIWSLTEFETIKAQCLQIIHSDVRYQGAQQSKKRGMSIRCIKI